MLARQFNYSNTQAIEHNFAITRDNDKYARDNSAQTAQSLNKRTKTVQAALSLFFYGDLAVVEQLHVLSNM